MKGLSQVAKCNLRQPDLLCPVLFVAMVGGPAVVREKYIRTKKTSGKSLAAANFLPVNRLIAGLFVLFDETLQKGLKPTTLILMLQTKEYLFHQKMISTTFMSE